MSAPRVTQEEAGAGQAGFGQQGEGRGPLGEWREAGGGSWPRAQAAQASRAGVVMDLSHRWTFRLPSRFRAQSCNGFPCVARTSVG